jgi:hypothetical protein
MMLRDHLGELGRQAPRGRDLGAGRDVDAIDNRGPLGIAARRYRARRRDRFEARDRDDRTEVVEQACEVRLVALEVPTIRQRLAHPRGKEGVTPCAMAQRCKHAPSTRRDTKACGQSELDELATADAKHRGVDRRDRADAACRRTCPREHERGEHGVCRDDSDQPALTYVRVGDQRLQARDHRRKARDSHRPGGELDERGRGEVFVTSRLHDKGVERRRSLRRAGVVEDDRARRGRDRRACGRGERDRRRFRHVRRDHVGCRRVGGRDDRRELAGCGDRHADGEQPGAGRELVARAALALEDDNNAAAGYEPGERGLPLRADFLRGGTSPPCASISTTSMAAR